MALDSQARICVRLFAENGEELGNPVVLPTSTTSEELESLANQFLEKEDDPIPIAFRTSEGIDIIETIASSLKDDLDVEKGVNLVYLPQAVFRVRPVTRCTSSLPGHSEPVISVQFSPDGQYLASGSGDKTVRLWDLHTELPKTTCKGHTHWVLCIAWTPNGKKLASACKNGEICLWDPNTGNQIGKKLTGHKQWITSLAWAPLHSDPTCKFLASAGKDGNIRIWDTVRGVTERTLSGHTASVTCIRWGGEGLIYSGAQDRTVKVWRASDGVMCRSLTGHAHWINTLALNVDYVLRTGCFEPEKRCEYPGDDKVQEIALARYNAAKDVAGVELLVSGSDDFTMFLWEPVTKKQPIARLTGHQQLVNQVMFSPDTRIIASASFDKSIKLWDGRTGKFLTSLRGHVQSVYQISFSSDSRLLVSGSADSTLKIWDIRIKKFLLDLPGHGADVFAVDWSPDGERVVSGGKDCVLKLWRQ
uniref:NLE domain-containing protein n=1 Tax=Panagrolaimus sp. PS1159 TaxID=55785 RepID=A0AC35GHJ4_9BILA